MEKSAQYLLMLMPIVGVGVSIGVFQEKISSHTESIHKIMDVIASMDVLENHLKIIDSRLNRIEYGRDYVTSMDYHQRSELQDLVTRND